VATSKKQKAALKEKKATAQEFYDKWVSLVTDKKFRLETLDAGVSDITELKQFDEPTQRVALCTLLSLVAATERVLQPVDIKETVEYLEKHVELLYGLCLLWTVWAQQRPAGQAGAFYRLTEILMAWGDHVGVPVPSCWAALCEVNEGVPWTDGRADWNKRPPKSAHTFALALGEIKRLQWLSFRKAGKPLPSDDPLTGGVIVGLTELANHLGCHPSTAKRNIDNGTIPAKPMSTKRYLVHPSFAPPEKVSPHKSA
jgi:hypothetical protein